MNDEGLRVASTAMEIRLTERAALWPMPTSPFTAETPTLTTPKLGPSILTKVRLLIKDETQLEAQQHCESFKCLSIGKPSEIRGFHLLLNQLGTVVLV